jgi:DNA-3-methyladenine glycosylase
MRLEKYFFQRDVLEVAPNLIGKYLVRYFGKGKIERRKIIEVEAYKGENDKASHARFGKTPRNKIMWEEGGLIYVYFVYGMYWMLNIVTGKKNNPQAVLIRGVEGINGPGKLGKWISLDKTFYGEDLGKSRRIWVEDLSDNKTCKIKTAERVGVSYAGSWAKKKWRFILGS